MKLIPRLLTGAAVSACLLSFAGCGTAGSPAPADEQPTAESAAESIAVVKVAPSGTEIAVKDLSPVAVQEGDILSGSVTVTDGRITSAVCGCEIDGQSYTADTEMKYYSVYNSEADCCLFGTDVQAEQDVQHDIDHEGAD